MKLFPVHDIIICSKIYPFFPLKAEYAKSDLNVLYLKISLETYLWKP